MVKAELSHGLPVIVVTVRRNELELELLPIREVPCLTRADSLVPHSLESQLSGTTEISVATTMDSLDVVPALNFLVVVKLDCLQLQVDKEVSNRRVQFWVLLDKFMEMVQVC